jgi:hypothetical protein
VAQLSDHLRICFDESKSENRKNLVFSTKYFAFSIGTRLAVTSLATGFSCESARAWNARPQFKSANRSSAFLMKEMNMSEQSTNEPPCETATAAQPEAINLLEVMEICSDLCVTHPFRLLQILEECAVSPEITVAPLVAEIMWLKGSRFGKRLEQIH